MTTETALVKPCEKPHVVIEYNEVDADDDGDNEAVRKTSCRYLLPLSGS